ncbi:uncharacterized protein [Littorina saxatilis]|uniref:Uncharacterized protein n=1 Tax=Littorina saxatilis TaxID=31220 RepID=A0AAN9BPI3_9CAEN
MSGKEETCPTCGKQFKQLSRHKCKEQGATQLSDKDSEGQICPTCGKQFKQLSRHKCKEQGATQLSDTINSDFGFSKTGCKAPEEGEEECPYCGRTFKQLWRHKCKKQEASSHSSPAAHEDSHLDQVCHTCGRTFKQISRHKCKGYAAGPLQQVDSAGHSGARPKVKTEPGCFTPGAEAVTETTRPLGTFAPGTRLQENGRGDPEFPQNGRGYCTVIDTASLEEEADCVMSKLGLEALPKPNFEASSFFKAEVRLKEDEKKGVALAFRPFRERIVSDLTESTKWRWQCFNSGSSYDGTKVTRADEVDCMFHPDLPADWLQVVYTGAPPGFCFVKLKSSSSLSSLESEELRELCIKGCVSSTKFREKVFKLFENIVSGERRAKKDPSSKPGSPSYAVLFKATPTDHGLREISIDLVPALHIKSKGLPPKAGDNLKRVSDTDVELIKKAGFDIIPKEYQKAGYEDVRDILWRLSFSRAEKQLTKHADKRTRGDQHGAHISPPTCRKWVLRMLKRFLEIIKGFKNSRDGSELNPVLQGLQNAAIHLKTRRGRNVKIEKFTTFQVRTLLWTEMYVIPIDDDKWTVPMARTRLIQALDHLKKMVSGRMHVPHFFLPGLDIMAEVPREEREFLYIMFHIILKLF